MQKEFLKEIIVVDDHSTDDSLFTLRGYEERYPTLIKVYINADKGGNNARNYGFSMSTGAFIQWLDADDQVLPGKFSAQLDVFSRLKGIDIVYSDWRLDTYNENGEIGRTETKIHKQYDDFLYELLVDNWSPPHNYILKRAIAGKLDEMQAWNSETPVLQDREYFTLAAINGATFHYTPGVFSVYNRWSRQSVSNNKSKRNDTLLDLLYKFMGCIDNNAALDISKKKYYKKIIITNRLLTKLSGGNPLVKDKEIAWSNIYWPLIKGYSTRIKMMLSVGFNFFK